MIETLEIAVTRQHTQQGKMNKPSQCPIAYAVFDATGTVPFVANDCIYISGKAYDIPQSAQDFITLFDYGIVPDPIAFTATRSPGKDPVQTVQKGQ